MKYIKTYEKSYVTEEEHEIMKNIRVALLKYFGRYESVSVAKKVDTNFIDIKIWTGPKNPLAKKFMDVTEYIGIGRKLAFLATINQLTELLNIFKKYRVDEISDLMSQAKKYKL